MIVTDVKRQVNNKQKVSIFVDGAYYDSLFDEIYAMSKIEIGSPLDEDYFMELKTQSEGRMAFNKSLDYLGHRMRSIKEMRDYLTKKDYCDEAIDYAIDKLIHYKYLDDAKFAKSFLNDRLRIKKRGKRRIISELKTKHIDNHIIEEIMENFDYKLEYENALDIAKKLIKKYRKEEDPYKRKSKISANMARNGYDYETINSAVNEINDEDEY